MIYQRPEFLSGRFYIMNLERTISDLLYEHDCVIIPGLGGFIGNYAPTRINPVHHTFSPPGKTLLFNINLKQNDGLLANKIARDNGISYEEAMQLIVEFVGHSKSLLKEGKQIRLDNIGIVYIDNRGALQFDQDKTINWLPDSYGLTSILSLPVQRHGLHIRHEKKTRGRATRKKRLFPAPLKWAAILALPVGAAVLFGILNFDTIKNLPVSYSGLLYPAGTYVPPPAPAPNKVKITLQPPCKLPYLRSGLQGCYDRNHPVLLPSS